MILSSRLIVSLTLTPLAVAALAPVREAAAQVSQGCFVQVGSSRVDLQACKLEYSIVSPK